MKKFGAYTGVKLWKQLHKLFWAIENVSPPVRISFISCDINIFKFCFILTPFKIAPSSFLFFGFSYLTV